MRDEIKGLMARITSCVPQSKIVLVVSDYYLISDNNERILINHEDIEMLINDGYIQKNRVGGVVPTVKAFNESDSFWHITQVPGMHGKMVNCLALPPNYR